MGKAPEPARKQNVEGVHQAVGARIRMIREALDIDQGELAKRVGLTRPSVNNIEQGRQRLQLQTVDTLARALGTTAKNLLKGIWW
jgi:transcriptional regulator with XRE-family HTH domain